MEEAEKNHELSEDQTHPHDNAANQIAVSKRTGNIGKKILFFFLSLFLIIGFVEGSIYLFKMNHPRSATTPKNNLQEIINQQKATTTGTPEKSSITSSINPAMNIYHNSTYKFSLPYPNNLSMKELPYGFGVTSIEMRAPDNPAAYAANYQILLFPKVLGTTIGQDFDNLYGTADNTSKSIKDPSGASVKFTKDKNRTINGLRAVAFTSESVPKDPQEESEIGVYIELGTNVIILSTGESNKITLETMLREFKYPL